MNIPCQCGISQTKLEGPIVIALPMGPFQVRATCMSDRLERSGRCSKKAAIVDAWKWKLEIFQRR